VQTSKKVEGKKNAKPWTVELGRFIKRREMGKSIRLDLQKKDSHK